MSDLTRAEIEHIANFGAGRGRPSQKVKQVITQILRQLDATDVAQLARELLLDKLEAQLRIVQSSPMSAQAQSDARVGAALEMREK